MAKQTGGGFYDWTLGGAGTGLKRKEEKTGGREARCKQIGRPEKRLRDIGPYKTCHKGHMLYYLRIKEEIA